MHKITLDEVRTAIQRKSSLCLLLESHEIKALPLFCISIPRDAAIGDGTILGKVSFQLRLCVLWLQPDQVQLHSRRRRGGDRRRNVPASKHATKSVIS